MGEPDTLARQADHGSDGNDNKGLVLLNPSVFQIHVLRASLVHGLERDVLQDIRESLKAEGTMEEVVTAAARKLRQAKANNQVHKTEWDKADSLLTLEDASTYQTPRTCADALSRSTMTPEWLGTQVG